MVDLDWVRLIEVVEGCSCGVRASYAVFSYFAADIFNLLNGSS